MNLIKLEDLNAVPLEEFKRKLDKKYGRITVEDDINEIREELDSGEIETNLVNNVIPKPEKFGEPFRKNTYFIRPRYVPAGVQPIFSLWFILRKTTTFEEVGLTPISQMAYILNTDGARNWEEIFEHGKRGMNNALNLNTTWAAVNFLNYIEHSFSDTVAD